MGEFRTTKHLNKEKYYKEDIYLVYTMVKCDYCGKNVDSLPWTCKRCGQTFCDNHRLPENHDCSRINQKNFFEPLTKRTTPKYKEYKSKSYEVEDEMYIPSKKKHHFSFNFSI